MATETMKILVVDDEDHSREFYVSSLIGEGYDAIGVTNGQAALDHLADSECDFVLLDILMDGIDGLETCKRIREDLGLTNLPICMITASMDMGNVVSSFEYGANGYIVKPFDLDELVRKIHELRLQAA